MLGGLIIHPRERAGAVLRHYRDFMASAPEELTAYAGLICSPDGAPVVAVIICWCGDPAVGERQLKELRAFGPPLVVAIQLLPFPAMQKLLDDAFPEGTYNYWKSTFVKELSDSAIDMIVTHANRMQSPLSAVIIEFYGGAAGRIGEAATAFAHRQSECDIGFMAQWKAAVENDKHVAWARDAVEALKPYSSGRLLLNFVGEEGPDTIRVAFGSNYARLAELKAKYDPANFFSLNQNVKPAR